MNQVARWCNQRPTGNVEMEDLQKMKEEVQRMTEELNRLWQRLN
jgi:uncharacterized FlaG/YvyC family protein